MPGAATGQPGHPTASATEWVLLGPDLRDNAGACCLESAWAFATGYCCDAPMPPPGTEMSAAGRCRRDGFAGW